MKAICLASVMTVVLLVLVTFCFRLYPSAHRARQMLFVYLFCLALLVALWFATPDDLGLLDRSLLAEPAWLDFAAMLLDRKSTRLNSSHLGISYAVFCL